MSVCVIITIEILEQQSEWVYCKLLIDNYCGWVKKTKLR